MYQLQRSPVPLQQHQPLPLLQTPIPNVFIMKRPLVTNTMRRWKEYFNTLFSADPVNAPPWASQHKIWRFRTAEPQPSQYIPELSGSVVNDQSTGIDQGVAWIDASDNTRAGKVWRTPSKNLLIADCNLF